MAAARWVVLASGSGTLLQALLDSESHTREFHIVALISDQPDALAISRAAQAGIAVAVLPLSDFPNREAWDQAMADAIAFYQPDFVASAGFMRILGPRVLAVFGGKIINTHPALLPAFPGAHAVRDALAAGVSVTGCSVHFVDEGIDTGPLIVQESLEVLPGDSESSLHERIKVVERRLLLRCVLDLSRKLQRAE